jgi:hypothetical protein
MSDIDPTKSGMQDPHREAPLWFRAAYALIKPRPYNRMLHTFGLGASFVVAAGIGGFQLGSLPVPTHHERCVVHLDDGKSVLVRRDQVIVVSHTPQPDAGFDQSLQLALAPPCKALLAFERR